MGEGEAQMERVVFSGTRRVELEKSELRAAGPGELAVRSRYSMISPGTELALYSGTHVGFGDPDIPWAKYPLYPGYSTVGVVEQTGAGGQSSEPAGDAPKTAGSGRAVAGFPAGTSVLHYQPHASHVLLKPDESMCIPIPDERMEHFLFVRFAQIAHTALAATHVDPRRVLVLGAGIVGNLCAQIFSAKGAEVAIADLLPTRLRVAEQCGISATIDAKEQETQQEQVRERLGEPDVVVEATGAPALVERALRIVRRGGEVVLLGSTRGEVTLNVYKLIHRKGTLLTGAHESRIPFLDPEGGMSHERVAGDMVRSIAQGSISVTPLITTRVPARRIETGYQRLSAHPAEELGVIVEWEENDG